MESELDFHTAKALLEWQIDLGATEAISEAPINRYDTPQKAPKAPAPTAETAAPEIQTQGPDPVAAAKELAQGAATLDALRDAIALYPHCEMKNGARNLVFSDGTPEARVMIIGEAPGRDEDREGRPFVGRAGQLLDAMLAAINHGRESPENPVYITNVMPWRPPQNRNPEPDEIAMMLPFLIRHIELAKPEILVLMGNIACQALLKEKGITKLRGTWMQAQGLPALPMFHPAYLLRTPAAKREAWHDLLMLQAKLRETGATA